MPDEIQPPRKRGRPPKAPGESVKRPNVSLRLKQELYDHVVQQARENGRSLSEEMERRVEDAFAQRDIIAAAVEGATNAAAARMEGQYVEFFGGQDGFTWAKSSADLYRNVMRELIREYKIKSTLDINEEFKSELIERVKRRLSEVSDLWSNMLVMSQLFEQHKGPIKDSSIDRLFKAAPELNSKLEGYIKRRTKKGL